MKRTKDDITGLIIISILTMILFSSWINMHYGTDTYNIINVGYEHYAINNSLKDGRIVMSGFMLLMEYLNCDIIVVVRITLIMAILISCISVLYLKNIILICIKEKNKIANIIAYAISYLIIFNFMYLDNLYFVECMVMSISVLLYLIAANIIVKKEKGYFYKSLLLVIIGMFCYQGTINFVFTMTIVLLFAKHRKINKEFLKEIITCCIIIIIPVLLNMVQIKIVENLFNIKQYRMGGVQNIIRNIKYIFDNIFYMMIKTERLLPNYLFLIMTSLLILFSYIYYMKYNQKEIYHVLNIILISIVAIFSCYAIHIVSLSSFGAGRLSFSMRSIMWLNINVLFYYNACIRM